MSVCHRHLLDRHVDHVVQVEPARHVHQVFQVQPAHSLQRRRKAEGVLQSNNE